MRNLLGDKGFTLVEVMVALLITGILMVIVFRFVFDQMRGYQRETMVVDAQQNVRVAMDQITRDIRMAGSGIPAVPIYTGDTDITGDVIYPLYIVQGPNLPAANSANQMFRTASTANNVNDSIIIIYQDPEMSAANTVLTRAMATSNANIVVDASAAQAFLQPSGSTNTPFIIMDTAGTKADLYMMTGNPAANSVSASESALPHAVSGGVYTMYNDNTNAGIGHDRNFNAAASGGATVLGYVPGDKVIAVKVVRYDWSYDLANANYPITRLVNADTIRATDNSIGEFFGSTNVTPVVLTGAGANQAMDIQYSPFYGANSSAVYYQSMPASQYNIGVVRVTLTARTATRSVNVSNTSMSRTRTLTSDVQLRNYGK